MDFSQIQGQLKDMSLEQLESLVSWMGDYETPPVHISQFLEDKNYLGGYLGNSLFPYWKRILCDDLYPSPFVDKYWLIVFRGSIGKGKCLQRDTKVLMFDGTTKMVQDVKQNDLLMGDDSKPRLVLNTTSGKEELFHIKPKKWSGYTVNKSHVLTLKVSGNFRYKNKNYKTGDILDIPLEDFLKLSKSVKHLVLKTFKTSVDFPKKEVLIDPYFLGAWLGDGDSRGPGITTMDEEIAKVVYEEAKKYKNIKHFVRIDHNKRSKSKNYTITTGRTIGGYNRNQLTQLLKYYNLINNKHIPQEYLINDRESRLQLLAGLLDTDGELNNNCYKFGQKSKLIIEQVQYLARSLGFNCSDVKHRMCKCGGKIVGPYYHVSISGHIDSIPVKLKRKKAKPRKQIKDPIATGFEVISKGEGDYFGFEVNGNGRFLLGDFTVTHNSSISTICVAYELYRLLCKINPQESFGLIPSSKIVFAILNRTLSLSSDVTWDKLSQIFTKSPCFNRLLNPKRARNKEETLFPKRIDFTTGSRFGHTLGQDVLYSIIDEANFNVVESQMYETFNSIIARMESRFMKPGGGIGGKCFVISSESDTGSTVNNIVDKYRHNPGVYVDQSAIWEVVTHKNGIPMYSGKTFWVYKGSEARPPEMLSEEAAVLKQEPDNCLAVPVEHKDRFDADIHAALRDLGGVSTGSSYRLFRVKEKLYKSMIVNPVFPDVIRLDFDDETDQIINYLLEPGFFDKPVRSPRYIHLDMGLTGDKLGIGCSYVRGFRERTTRDISTFQEVTETVPEIVTEWHTTIEAQPGKQIPLYKIRLFIVAIAKRGYMIDKITADLKLLSADTLQALQKHGFKAEYLSVDKSPAPYYSLRNGIYEERYYIPNSNLAKKELSELEVTPDGTKIDHPKEGSKDLSDAICGSVYSAEQNADRTKFIYFQPDKHTQKSSQVIDLFWGNK